MPRAAMTNKTWSMMYPCLWKPGKSCALLGPNGAGKTTLFKAILGFLKLRRGEILLDGENAASLVAQAVGQGDGLCAPGPYYPFPLQSSRHGQHGKGPLI